MMFFNVISDIKEASLLYLLKTNIFHNKDELEPEQAIIFVSSKHMVEYIGELLKNSGYKVGMLYGSMDFELRKEQMIKFRKKVNEILIVTDLAARGIDIPVLKYVVNYDFVDEAKLFVHRVGRCARNGMPGIAFSFLSSQTDLAHLYELEMFLARPIKIVKEDSKEEVDYVDQLVLGSFPTTVEAFREEQEFVNKENLENETNKLKTQSLNASKMVKKTRLSYCASDESYRKAKQLCLNKEKLETIHPIFRSKLDQSVYEERNFINHLSTFRPNEGLKNQTNASSAMQQRRSKYQKQIQAFNSRTQLNNEEQKEAVKDKQYYIDQNKKSLNAEKGYSINKGTLMERLQHMELTLNPDEKIKTNKIMKWDKNKNNFVRGTQIGKNNKKFIKDENGVKMPATMQAGKYQEWMQKTKLTLPQNGDNEIKSSNKLLSKALKLPRKNKYLKNELLNKEQLTSKTKKNNTKNTKRIKRK